jgi:hypothetical protein
MISTSTGSRGRSATFALYTAATKMILCCRAANNMTRAARRGTARKRIGVTLIAVGLLSLCGSWRQPSKSSLGAMEFQGVELDAEEGLTRLVEAVRRVLSKDVDA